MTDEEFDRMEASSDPYKLPQSQGGVELDLDQGVGFEGEARKISNDDDLPF